jgi:hypothetical protein
MKNIIFTTIALLSFTFSNAQIGEAKEIENYTLLGKYYTLDDKYGSLEYRDNDSGSKSYRWSMRDTQYTELNQSFSIFFDASDDDIDYLYDSLLSAFKLKERDEGISFQLGDGTAKLTRVPILGIRLTYFSNGVSRESILSKGNLRKLFNRRK